MSDHSTVVVTRDTLCRIWFSSDNPELIKVDGGAKEWRSLTGGVGRLFMLPDEMEVMFGITLPKGGSGMYAIALVRIEQESCEFPDHPVMPTKPATFDDSHLAKRLAEVDEAQKREREELKKEKKASEPCGTCNGDKEIIVCAECKSPACWAGEFMCEGARTADIAKIRCPDCAPTSEQEPVRKCGECGEPLQFEDDQIAIECCGRQYAHPDYEQGVE